MCGRVRCTLSPEQVRWACCAGGPDSGPLATEDLDKYRPSYNVSPGAYLPVVAYRKEKKKKAEAGGEDEGKDGERRPMLHCMKWGLVPSFTKKSEKPDHYRMFNARSESIAEKASFRRLIPNNRCLVAAEGLNPYCSFYEWKKDGSRKQPYYIHFQNERPLVFAALYDSWQNAEGELLYTFTILTTCSSSALQWLHDRMPVILGDKSSIEIWINSPTSNFTSVVRPYEGPDLVWYPVTHGMGKPTFDGLECIKEIQLKPPETKPISKFFPKKIVDETQPELDVQKTQFPEFSKEEADVETVEGHDTETVSLKKEHHETKKGGSLTTSEDGEKDDMPSVLHRTKGTDISGAKREYEQLVTGSKPSENLDDSKKKGRIIKQAGDGQATLFSYFRKN